MLHHNLSVYGPHLPHRVDAICADFLCIAPRLKLCAAAAVTEHRPLSGHVPASQHSHPPLGASRSLHHTFWSLPGA
ncbi:unnamed protein product [Closterium sp. Yama58-4]|nr:unnamed protein product [Closterium sp. Yama58-4]